MWLVHKPSKLGIMLGKRMAYGWYAAPEESELNRFYEYLTEDLDPMQDDFVLAMENCKESTCFSEWQYTEERIDGFLVFKFTNI